MYKSNLEAWQFCWIFNLGSQNVIEYVDKMKIQLSFGKKYKKEVGKYIIKFQSELIGES